MRHLNPFRLASYLLGLFTLGHTLGAVVTIPRFGPASDVVVTAMQSVHVRAQGADCTWYGFYRGFGWFVSIYLLLAAYVAWKLGGMDQAQRAVAMPFGWALLITQAATIPQAFIYFFPAPMVFNSAITLVLGIACVREVTRKKQRSSP
jgi:hypothetical protein